MHHIIKYGIAIAGSIVALLLAAGLFLTATAPGQRTLLDLVDWALSSETLTVETGELTGSLFDEGMVSRITVSDAYGLLAEVKHVRFGWYPSDLLEGRITVQALQIGRVEVRSLPAGDNPEANDAGDPIAESFSLHDFVGIAPPLRIERFEIAEAVLADEVLGVPARLSMSGQINSGTPNDLIAISLSVQDMDRVSFAKANAEYRADAGTLRIAVNAEEKAGGILNTLLDIDGAQDLKIAINGEGRLDNWRGDWLFSVNSLRMAGGSLLLNGAENGLSLTIDADGEIGHFLPGAYAALLAGESRFNLSADYLGQKQFRLRTLKLDAPRVRVSATGTADLSKHAIAGKGRVELGDGPNGEPVTIALKPDTKVSVRNAEIFFDAIPGRKGTELKVSLQAEGISANGNSLEQFSASASATQPAQISELFEHLVDVQLSARAQQPSFADPAFAPITGETVTFNLSGWKNASALTITKMTMNGAGGVVELSGMLDANGFKGETHVAIPDSGVLSAFAGHELSGPLSASASGNVAPSGDFNFDLEGTGQNLMAGSNASSKLFAGMAVLTGRISRSQSGLDFDKLSLKSGQFHLTADGHLDAQRSDLNVIANIPDIAAILVGAAGAAQIEVNLEGVGEDQTLAVLLDLPGGKLQGLPVEGLALSYEGRGGLTRQAGTFRAEGLIGQSSLTGQGRIALDQANGHSIRNFELVLGSNRLTVNAILPANGKAEGRGHLLLNDIALLSAVLGVPINGAAELEADLSGDAAAPHLQVKARSREFSYGSVRIASLNAAILTKDIFNHPIFTGQAAVKSIQVDGNYYGPLRIETVAEQNLSNLTVSAGVGNQANLSAKARIALSDWQPDISLSDILLKHSRVEIRQSGAAHLRKEGRRYRLDHLVLQSGKGELSVNAMIGETLNGKMTFSAFPLNVAGIFVSDIIPHGILHGEIDLSGPRHNPKANYRFSISDLAIPDALPPGFPSLKLSATGSFANAALIIDTRVGGADGISVRMKGTVDGVGTANALDLKTEGVIPLHLANSFLAVRGTQIVGSAQVNLVLAGRVDAPVLHGSIKTSQASLNDPPTGISLVDARFNANLSSGILQITKLGARSPKGGTVEGSGTIDISNTAKLPASLALSVRDLHFSDGHIAAGQASSKISLKGDLLAVSKLSGSLDLSRLDLRIPQSRPASVKALELKHKNAPAYIQALQKEPEKSGKSKLPSTINLSLNIRSVNRIFVTGRGLDAQLGGQLRLSGSANDPRAIGQFTLERGRMSVLGRSLDIVSGTLDFSGDLDPRMNFTAITEANSTRITIIVSGNASNPQFSFSSEPELPEDEILALLLFNKSLGELSPVQIIQLASQVSELGGLTSGPGVLDKLKASIGVDRLEVTTTEDGEVAVSAGSYVNKKLYVGVEQGSPSNSNRVKVDLDITKNIKLRGEAGADGESKLGLGVEWEY